MSERRSGGGGEQPSKFERIKGYLTDKKETLDESRLDKLSNKYYKFLKVLFVAWNVAYLDHDDIIVAVERIPQVINASLTKDEARHTAEGLMHKYQEKIDKGEPLPVNLISLYLEQERLLGGTSVEDVAKARAHFDALAEAANRQQANHWSEEETLGWILKQQGNYNNANNRLTDLLLTGEGECEARAKFIEAMVQAVFPKYVAEGKLKLEHFRGHIDANGLAVPGHVRAVLDLTSEGKGIIILDGDAPHHEITEAAIAKHQAIGMYEATGTAVKGIAVKEGLTTWDKENAPHQAAIQKANRKDARAAKKAAANTDYVGKLEQKVHQALVNNTVSSYPEATATLGDGLANINRNVSSKKVAGSYAHAADDFKNPIELRLVHDNEPQEMLTIDNYETALTPDGVRLDKFKSYSAQALDALLSQRRARQEEQNRESKDAVSASAAMRIFAAKKNAAYMPVQLAAKSGIMVTEFNKYGPIAWKIKGNDLPPIYDIPTSSVEMENVSQISNGLSQIAWDDGAYLDITIANTELGAEGVRGGEILSVAINHGLKNITIKSNFAGDQWLAGADFGGAKLESLTLSNVGGGRLSDLTVDRLSWARSTGFQGGALANVKASDTVLRFNDDPGEQPGLNVKNGIEFDGGVFFVNGESDRFRTKTLQLQAAKDQYVMIMPAAFSGMSFDVLSLSSDIVLRENALENAKIDTLIVRLGQGAPSDMISTQAATTGHINRVVIIKSGETLLNKNQTESTTSAILHAKSGADRMILRDPLDRKEVEQFRQSSHIKAPIYVIIDQNWQQLINLFGDESHIPDADLFAMSYITP